jgi:hypothetical protein
MVLDKKQKECLSDTSAMSRGFENGKEKKQAE